MKWNCHLHANSNCDVEYVNDEYFHLSTHWSPTIMSMPMLQCITKDNICHESLGTIMPVSPLQYNSQKYNLEIFKICLNIFKTLDEHHLFYISDNKPSNFTRKHLCINTNGNVTLINRCLLKQNIKSKERYYRKNFIKAFLWELFPKSKNSKNSCGQFCILSQSATAPAWSHQTICKIWMDATQDVTNLTNALLTYGQE